MPQTCRLRYTSIERAIPSSPSLPKYQVLIQASSASPALLFGCIAKCQLLGCEGLAFERLPKITTMPIKMNDSNKGVPSGLAYLIVLMTAALACGQSTESHSKVADKSPPPAKSEATPEGR